MPELKAGDVSETYSLTVSEDKQVAIDRLLDRSRSACRSAWTSRRRCICAQVKSSQVIVKCQNQRWSNRQTYLEWKPSCQISNRRQANPRLRCLRW